MPCKAESILAQDLSCHIDGLYEAIEALRKILKAVPATAQAASLYYHDVVVPAMQTLRTEADALEAMTDKSFWPYPTYSDLLYY